MKEEFALKTIGEVSKSLNIPQYILRFWEKKFSIIKPIQKANGRRYYTKKDLDNLIEIKDLLYEEKYSLKGAQKVLENKRKPSKKISNDEINTVINKLKSLRDEIRRSI